MTEHLETHSPVHSPEPAFHADDTLEVADYRTVSALAIVSLVLGLASPLCFAWPLLLAIPLIGAVLSVVAIRRIDASDGALTGRRLAVVALVLCVASGAGAVTRERVMRAMRTSQAEQFGREWIELILEGETEKAFRLTVNGNRPQRPPEPGMPPPKETPYEAFVGDSLVEQLTAAGAGSAIRAAEVLVYEAQPRRQFVVQQRFRVTPNGAAEAKQQPVVAVLTLQRSQLRGEPRPRWLVADYLTQQSYEAMAPAR